MGVSGQHDEFAERLARINRNAGGPAVLVCGVDESGPMSPRAALTHRRGPSITFRGMMGFPFAFLLGVVAMIAGHAITFRFFEHVVSAADAMGITTMYAADIVVAALIALIVLMMFGYARKAYVMTAALGFAAIITQEIELARSFPDIWAQIYSPHMIESSLQAGEMLLPEIATSFNLI